MAERVCTGVDVSEAPTDTLNDDDGCADRVRLHINAKRFDREFEKTCVDDNVVVDCGDEDDD